MDALTLAYRDRLIERGLAEVTTVYEEGSYKREGAVEGFELLRSLRSLEEMEAVLAARERRERRMVRTGEALDRYWRHRYATLQIEFMLGRLRGMQAILSLSRRAGE